MLDHLSHAFHTFPVFALVGLRDRPVRPLFVRLPIVAHLVIARLAEWTMRVPLIATAQVHILAEGVVEPLPFAAVPPDDLAPTTPFDLATIRRGLPEPGGFGIADLRCASA